MAGTRLCLEVRLERPAARLREAELGGAVRNHELQPLRQRRTVDLHVTGDRAVLRVLCARACCGAAGGDRARRRPRLHGEVGGAFITH